MNFSSMNFSSSDEVLNQLGTEFECNNDPRGIGSSHFDGCIYAASPVDQCPFCSPRAAGFSLQQPRSASYPPPLLGNFDSGSGPSSYASMPGLYAQSTGADVLTDMVGSPDPLEHQRHFLGQPTGWPHFDPQASLTAASPMNSAFDMSMHTAPLQMRSYSDLGPGTWNSYDPLQQSPQNVGSPGQSMRFATPQLAPSRAVNSPNLGDIQSRVDPTSGPVFDPSAPLSYYQHDYQHDIASDPRNVNCLVEGLERGRHRQTHTTDTPVQDTFDPPPTPGSSSVTSSGKRRTKQEMFAQNSEYSIPCDKCHKFFSSPADAQKHMSRYCTENPRPHACPFPGCNARFNFPRELNRHRISGHGDPDAISPYPCAKCEKRFNRSDNRDRHERNVHGWHRHQELPSPPSTSAE